MVNIWAIQSLKDGAGCVLSIVRTSVMVTGACFIGFSLAATIGDTRSFLVLGGRLCHDQLTSFVSDHVLIRAPWFRRETHRQTDRRTGRQTRRQRSNRQNRTMNQTVVFNLFHALSPFFWEHIFVRITMLVCDVKFDICTVWVKKIPPHGFLIFSQTVGNF